jgi:hypothetical protein
MSCSSTGQATGVHIPVPGAATAGQSASGCCAGSGPPGAGSGPPVANSRRWQRRRRTSAASTGTGGGAGGGAGSSPFVGDRLPSLAAPAPEVEWPAAAPVPGPVLQRRKLRASRRCGTGSRHLPGPVRPLRWISVALPGRERSCSPPKWRRRMAMSFHVQNPVPQRKKRASQTGTVANKESLIRR